MQRPARIVVFGVLCLIVGGVSGLNHFSTLGVALTGPSAVQVPTSDGGMGMFGEMQIDLSRAMKAALHKRSYRLLLGIGAAAGAVMAIVLISAGIGLLRDRLLSVRLARAWAIYAIAGSVLTVVLHARYVMPGMTTGSPSVAPASTACMLPFLWLFPVLLLTVLPRPVVIDYLRSKAGQVRGENTAPDARALFTDSPADPGSVQDRVPPRSAQDTWRDDPWNDPGSK